jgi:TolA-binding protein
VSTSAGSKRPRLLLALGAVLLGALLAPPSCVTSTEGDKMRSDIDSLRVRLDEIDKRDKEYKEQVVRLRKVLDEATALLTRNSADVGAKVAKSEQDIAAIQGRIEELAHNVDVEIRQTGEMQSKLETRLAALEQTQTKIVDRVAPEMPTDKDQLWTQAGQRLASGQRDDGRRFYRVFIQRFPQDPRAPQAYLAIGMSFVQESKYANAAAEFQKVLQNYPASPEVPEAMWQLSLAFVQLHFCSDARALLSDLVKRYPKSARAADARGELRSIAKLPKSSCTS